MFPSSITTNFDLLTLEPLPPETRQRLLHFPLQGQETGLLPLEQIAEILRLNLTEILPVPAMPSCILGACNWRGETLWLIDLNHLIGDSPLSQADFTSLVAIVVQVNEQAIGLVVNQVYDIELHDLQQLQPVAPGLFAPKLIPFVLGALPGDQGIVLDVSAIAKCPLWHIHQPIVA
jgi:positive phototaxis protein PixI